MEVCMVSVEACMWPNSCSVIMLSFMLCFSCAYDGIYIGNERWMNLMEYGNIVCWPWPIGGSNGDGIILFNTLVALL